MEEPAVPWHVADNGTTTQVRTLPRGLDSDACGWFLCGWEVTAEP